MEDNTNIKKMVNIMKHSYTLLQDKWSDWDRQLASSIEYWHKRFPSCASIQVCNQAIYFVTHDSLLPLHEECVLTNAMPRSIL